jgi:hypothetical protein
MAKQKNTRTAGARNHRSSMRIREYILKNTKWWIIIPVVALMTFGCEKDVVDSISDETSREKLPETERLKMQDVSTYDALVLQSNDVDDNIAKCIIMSELPDWATRYFVLNRAEIEGDRLIINVSYPGGARPHAFKLVSTTFQESNPVQVRAQVFHFGNDDHHDHWITEVREFDLSPLKALYIQMYRKPRGTIIINLIDIFTSTEAAPLIYKFYDDAILPPEPPLPPEYYQDSW